MSSKSTKKKNPALPAHLEEQRTRVYINNDQPTFATVQDHHGIFSSLNYDNSFSMTDFMSDFEIKIISQDERELVFDMIGCDPAIANALRRIMIAEVPTVAIERVFITQNTSIIPDEILAHRLGLIPINVDPREFLVLDPDTLASAGYSDDTTVVFKLDIECKRNPTAQTTDPPERKFLNSRVYSGDLVWHPEGDQAEKFEHKPPAPVDKDILIAELRPGQQITATCYCEKNIGKEHAKWSPVCPVSYRLLPVISFTEPVTGREAEDLKKRCPLDVFDIEDYTAVAARPRDCTMCRECIREGPAADKVKLQRLKTHFIWTIESAGMLTPAEIFEEAIKVFVAKLQAIKDELQKVAAPNE